MAYKLETLHITPGGLNLVAPGDVVADGDCLDLRGVWPGSAGRLEVAPAPGMVVMGPVATDSICCAGSVIYSGSSAFGKLYKAGAEIGSGFDPAYPLGMISFQGNVWVINSALQKKYDGAALSDWTIGPPAIPTLSAAAGGGMLNIPYSYYVTWQTALGETDPSPVAVITPAADGIITIAHPAAPTIATGWNIYREVGSIPYLLNEDGPLPISRATVDDYGDEIHWQSDTQMLRLGIIMEADHDAAPAARIMANQVYNGRIVVANTAAHPNRIYYTQALQPSFFRGAANPFDGDWVDCGTDSGDEILGLSVRPNYIIIYRAKSIWRHVGDFGTDDARLEPLVPEIGIVGPHAFCTTSIGDFFRGPEGVYKLTDWAQKISPKVETLFRAGGAAAENFLNESDPSKCALGYENGRLWVSYKEAVFSAGLIYHLDTQRWFACKSGFNVFAPGDGELLGGSGGIYNVRYGGGGSDLRFQSAYLDGGLPDHEKTWADLVLDYSTGGNPLTVTIRTNKKRTGSDEFVVATLSSYDRVKQIIKLVYPATFVDGSSTGALAGKPVRAYNLSVRITGDDIPAGSAIESPILLHYYVEARQAKTFDSDETDHGMQGVKEVDQVELDIDTSAGTAQLLPYSDVPGGAMAPRALEGIIQTDGGRRIVLLVLTAPIDGRLLRYTLYTTTTLQLYGMRARVLPIGVYLDGFVSDFWAPQPISVGI